MQFMAEAAGRHHEVREELAREAAEDTARLQQALHDEEAHDLFLELSDAEQQAFVRLLEHDDPDLLFWFSQKGKSSEPELQELVDRILHRVQPV